jgi:hypothetical protein
MIHDGELQDIKAHGAPFVVIESAHEIGKQHCNFIIGVHP